MHRAGRGAPGERTRPCVVTMRAVTAVDALPGAGFCIGTAQRWSRGLPGLPAMAWITCVYTSVVFTLECPSAS